MSRDVHAGDGKGTLSLKDGKARGESVCAEIIKWRNITKKLGEFIRHTHIGEFKGIQKPVMGDNDRIVNNALVQGEPKNRVELNGFVGLFYRGGLEEKAGFFARIPMPPREKRPVFWS